MESGLGVFTDQVKVRNMDHVGSFYQSDSRDARRLGVGKANLGGMPVGLPTGPSLWYFYCHWKQTEGNPARMSEQVASWLHRTRREMGTEWIDLVVLGRELSAQDWAGKLDDLSELFMTRGQYCSPHSPMMMPLRRHVAPVGGWPSREGHEEGGFYGISETFEVNWKHFGYIDFAKWQMLMYPHSPRAWWESMAVHHCPYIQISGNPVWGTRWALSEPWSCWQNRHWGLGGAALNPPPNALHPRWGFPVVAAWPRWENFQNPITKRYPPGYPWVFWITREQADSIRLVETKVVKSKYLPLA